MAADVWCRRRYNMQACAFLAPGQPNESSLSLGHVQYSQQFVEARRVPAYVPEAGPQGKCTLCWPRQLMSDFPYDIREVRPGRRGLTSSSRALCCLSRPVESSLQRLLESQKPLVPLWRSIASVEHKFSDRESSVLPRVYGWTRGRVTASQYLEVRRSCRRG